MNINNNICPVSLAGPLDSGFRKLFHDPNRILSPFIKAGQTVIDLGCGPGFFTIEMAKLVGATGKVIAADLQSGMLKIVEAKIKNTDYEKIIKLHETGQDSLRLNEQVDLIFIFYMLHEVPDQVSFLKEVKASLKTTGRVLIVEPKFHVSQKAFNNSINMAKELGFEINPGPSVFFSRSAFLTNRG
jgi:ubiquinone/menaquinone biosynthesis C-methylase UbiE